MIKSSFGGMYELSWRHSIAHPVWCGNMCHVICKYRTFLTLMETPGLEAPQRGNEGMANCTQTVHLLYTTPHSGREENGNWFIKILLQTTRIRYLWRSLVFKFIMLVSRLCSPSVVMFGLGPDQYRWLGWGYSVLVYCGHVTRAWALPVLPPASSVRQWCPGSRDQGLGQSRGLSRVTCHAVTRLVTSWQWHHCYVTTILKMLPGDGSTCEQWCYYNCNKISHKWK